MTPRLRPAAALALALLAALGLAACGSRTDPQAAAPRLHPFTVVLDYFPNADHAGIYAAQASGAFRRAGLDVKVVAPSDPTAPLKLVQAGRADLAISYEPELLLARDQLQRSGRPQGESLVSVGALVDRPLTSIISLPRARISSPADLRGKTVGTAGLPYQAAYLRTILKRAGVPESSVRVVDLGFDLVPGLLSNRVDAILGGYWNYEGVQLQREDRRPQVLRVDQVGVPSYDELIFVADEKALRTQPGRGALVRRFLQAMQEGTRTVEADPARGVDALLDAAPDLSRSLQTAAVRATLPTFLPPRGQPYGFQDPAAWAAYARWMQANGLIQTPRGNRPYTNEFLPGQGVLPSEGSPDQAPDPGSN